jgi:hypothetical protein
MSGDTKTVGTGKKWLLTLDSWAVLAAFAAALLIRAGVDKKVTW